jgi:UDP-glucose-4-epimerase GalE
LTILVTGGAGYIGSHVCKALHAKGYRPVVYDNLSHGNSWAVQWGPFIQGDIHDFLSLSAAIEYFGPIAAIHLAGSIHARESTLLPHSYYYNNVEGSRIFFQSLVENGISCVVSTSSAAVYDPTNAYGKSKKAVEGMLEDFAGAFGIEYASLRCFNVAGADIEGKIGEAHPKETHLIPLMIETALGKRDHVPIYGDGSSLRDYVHVSDVANAHVLALEHLLDKKGSLTVDIGTGSGYNIWGILQHVEKITEKKIPYILNPKNNESVQLIANPEKARSILKWRPECSELSNIIQSAWNWHNQCCLCFS